MARGHCKIDTDRLREMVQAHMTTPEIADAFDCTTKAVTEHCRAKGIPSPVRHYQGRVAPGKEPRPALAVVPKPGPVHPPRMAALIATGGRYADLAAWAKAWGVTETKARQEWFALRLPVTKGVGHG